ncbi:hypothetical protein ABLO27_12815 [Roseibium sp. SCPC15]|uniref:hypothetical protein n=1 Tax=Roseibium sp. SCP15 TaxID=3141376 RepID=UPI00333C62F0
MSHLVPHHLDSSDAVTAFLSSELPDRLQATRPLAWWRRDGQLKASEIDLIAVCLNAARAVTAKSIPDTGDLTACCQALKDHMRSGRTSQGDNTSLDLLASALLVAIDCTRERLVECAPESITNLCLPVSDDCPEPLPGPSAIPRAEALLQQARRSVAVLSDKAICREVCR